MEDLKQLLYRLEKENPNNMDFGNKVRLLVWQMKKDQSKKLAEEQLPGQLDMFNHGS